MSNGRPTHLTLRAACLAAWLAILACTVAWVGQTEGPIRVQVNAHDFAFGQQVRFELQVASDHPIQSIVLAYRTLDTGGTTVETMRFAPGTSVHVEHVHQVQRRYIRPFVELTYWWTIVNAAGDQLITDAQSFVYTDNRFNWQTLSDGAIRVHWYQGEIEIARQALDVAIAGLDRARQDVDVDAIRKAIEIYLYASYDDLQLALPAPFPAGMEALTLYETNVVLVAFGPQAMHIPHLRRVLPHEVTHALLHEATRSAFDQMPLWLSEGLATSVQQAFAPDPDMPSLLEEAIQERRLIPLNALCAAFPSDLARARLAYAESASFVNWIRDLYGRQALRDLVAAYADGATCTGGVQRVFNGSLDRLDAQWRETLAPPRAWAAFWDENGAWVVLALLLAGLPLAFILPAHKQEAHTWPNQA